MHTHTHIYTYINIYGGAAVMVKEYEREKSPIVTMVPVGFGVNELRT